ncbi:hypothetical protein M2322_003536 [Rhodoblastus acidophilus]|uniref:hypothetical protein n=1 Tax=Rhodoblastus acidophilus TaxID=1074 RepID=UPI002224F1B5|nr:hypothetical protein [Rhodoblastus acidophilus]MCW2317971.1 hypothetical protein [Rhodoblastus acidophilus]
MDRERQIELMKSAEARTTGYLRAWIAKPQFKAALHRDHRSDGAAPAPQRPKKHCCGG